LVDDQSEGRDGAKYSPYLPIALIERASSPDQRLITSTLANIESAIKSVEERPPGMMLIGWSVLALEGKGRIDILDKKEQGDEEEVVKEWLGGVRWKIREGLDWGWGEFLGDLGRV
jgi:uroporphyrin-III C-methyltransferase